MIKRGLLFALCFVLSVSTNASALTSADYSTNDIDFYDKNASCGVSSTTGSSGSINTSADQDAKAEAILKFFTGKGMTLAQATGFTGNMIAESGLNPAIIEGGAIAPVGYKPENGKGFGLVQWTWTSRQGPLVELATSTSRDVTEMGVQLDYVWQELNGTYKSTLQALQARQDEQQKLGKSITPTDAAIIVHGNTWKSSEYSFAPDLGYEASADTIAKMLANRASAAESFYQKFKDTIKDGAGINLDGVTTNSTVGVTSTNSCAPSAPSDCQPHTPIGDKGPEQHARIFGAFLDSSNWVPVGTFMDFTFPESSNPTDGHTINKVVLPCLRAVEAELKASPSASSYSVWSFMCSRNDIGNPQFYHGYAAACDINPANGGKGNGCGFCAGWGMNNHDIPDEWVTIFEKYGWYWGGHWGGGTNGDWMHFQYEGPESERGK